ncbi:MAG: YaiI/YqxD family protein [Alphaproteobacteria bacterium]|nr:MAG: YaiI/YqxD family protein [Alphaproteobacteria bacterium]
MVLSKPAIYVDGDACPVKKEIVRVAERHGLSVFLVANAWIHLPHPLVEMVVVTAGPDEADNWIAENIAAGDICITADIPLASRCLERDGRVIGPTGKPFTQANIGNALAMRELKSHLRETGEDKGFNPTFTKNDRSQFLQALEQQVQAALRQR